MTLKHVKTGILAYSGILETGTTPGTSGFSIIDRNEQKTAKERKRAYLGIFRTVQQLSIALVHDSWPTCTARR